MGPDHPNVAAMLTNLGDAGKKRDLLERAFDIEERSFGRNHPKVATTLAGLGDAYSALGDAGR